MGYYRKGYFGDGHLSADGAALAEFIPKAFRGSVQGHILDGAFIEAENSDCMYIW